MKNNILIIIGTFIITIVILYSFNLINTNKDKEIEQLNTEIINLKNEINQYKEDKQFYKNLYVSMAKEYENRLHELGIEEYILTDTSR